MAMANSSKFHVVMFPWFATTSPSSILPKKAQPQLQHLNLHPTLISFHPLTIPHVDGLPPGAETASDVPIFLHHLLATAMDRITDQVEAALRALKPDFFPVCAAAFAYNFVPAQQIRLKLANSSWPPPGYPSSTVVLGPHEARLLQFLLFPFGEDITFHKRLTAAIKRGDIVAIGTCQEVKGPFCGYMERQFGKPMFVTGPVLLAPSPLAPEDRRAQWLGGFKPGSVIFCAFGSQNFPEKDRFQELLLGFERTGLPFPAALKPPLGAATIEEALPEGFQERVGGRGVVHGGWVPQPSILCHPSVGCFVSHCGFGSIWESLMSDPQIVLREENGWVSKESLCKAIKSVMDEEIEVGCLVKKNHAEWKETPMSQGFMCNYIDNFVRQILDLK
ncbi:hypothetical protein PVL29_025315 [Vitis rotundifolia]|uniref:Glycosyltransferase n=1 Tax=Vitis rotundifolia TaxID=103349 RepID=A0AA38YJF9_VITRO|nr:hypothetical protein PVL29_025315 [Vitis rotundifolia]